MWADFKKFILRGNILDMAVGITVGVAFGATVTSLVNDVIMPPIGLLLGGADFSNLFVNLGPGRFETLAAAEEAGAPILRYGVFLNTLITFLIIAVAVFFLVRAVQGLMERRKKEEEPGEPTTKKCPECLSEIPIGAHRCAFCTSVVA